MTKRWLDVWYCSRPELRPARALLSPVWLGALALLAVNDHLLKGAAIIPGGVTGKLSDIAGMLVAPALLAALLGLRSRRGLLHCHIAVGLVFAAINLSPAAADAWSWLMGLVGFPWAITVDPTDLLALPALALGWRALTPAMQPVSSDRTPSAPRWRVPEYGAAALGALLCVATSPSEPGDWEPGDTTYPPVFADAYLHNSHPELELIVRVRELRPDVQVDCFQVERDPGVLFSEPLFGEGQTWAIPAGANVPARVDAMVEGRECHAVLLTGDTIAPTILFWYADELEPAWIEGQHATSDEYLPGIVVLTADDDGVAAIDGDLSDNVYPQRPAAADAYLPRSDATRVDWSAPIVGVHRIADLELGSDGCAAFTFGGGIYPRFYLCTPLTELPFAIDEYVSVEDHGDLVILSRAPSPVDPGPVPEIRLAVTRGPTLPTITGTTLAVKPSFNDNLGPDPACGTVAQPQEFHVKFGDRSVAFAAGETATLDDGAHTLTLHGVRAERRFIVDDVCAEGPATLGDDLEMVLLWTDAPAP